MACAHPDLRIISPTSCARQAPLTKTKGSKQYTARNHCTYTRPATRAAISSLGIPHCRSRIAARAETSKAILNRFAAVSSWLERNARIGKLPTEDTVTRAEAAQIDMALLENPALIALKPDDEFGADPRLTAG